MREQWAIAHSELTECAAQHGKHACVLYTQKEAGSLWLWHKPAAPASLEAEAGRQQTQVLPRLSKFKVSWELSEIPSQVGKLKKHMQDPGLSLLYQKPNFLNRKNEAGIVVLWWSACLVCSRSWAEPWHCKKGVEKREIKYEKGR